MARLKKKSSLGKEKVSTVIEMWPRPAEDTLVSLDRRLCENGARLEAMKSFFYAPSEQFLLN